MEELFDHSLIPGQGYWGSSKEHEYLGISTTYYNHWGAIHEHDPCSLRYVRRIPEDDTYDAEIIDLGEKTYLIKIYVDDPILPKEIEVRLNGRYYEQVGEYYAYFDIKETDLYESSNCNAAHIMFTRSYFEHSYFGTDAIQFHFELKSKTGDSLVWSYVGTARRH